jgi:hypothetical protein
MVFTERKGNTLVVPFRLAEVSPGSAILLAREKQSLDRALVVLPVV